MSNFRNAIFSLFTLAAVMPACTLSAGTFGPPLAITTAPTNSSSSPGEAAPTRREQFPVTGGLTPQTAEVVTMGMPIEGLVEKQRRYYQFDVVAGQQETFTIYSELAKKSIGGSNLSVRLLASDGEKLGGEFTATYASSASPELDKDDFDVVFKSADSILMEVSCSCALSPVHYKILTASR